ncbi:MATE family efflux transporter [Sulfitobacter aestuariivivens]|uniref:MATE family efflux transporter n=1 Tax=Sulfitobacter aestuariivivens TaxID=2766981 RepID=UPI003605B8D6
MAHTPANTFTHGPLGLIFAKTALPIIFVMGMNGLLTVVDAIFLGRYVGPDALGAVTLIFPLYMVIVALATLVSNGMSSILARHLGANDHTAAARVFVGAHGMALLMSGVLIAGYLVFGRSVTLALASGSEPLAEMGQVYLAITAFMAPLAFILAVNSDALRNEGHVGFMAAMSLLVSLSNIGFNYLLIAIMGLGVAGSAWGTALAQLLALSIIIGFRITRKATLQPSMLLAHDWRANWTRILALGAPQSLSFIGIALSSAAVIVALQMVNTPKYESTVAAFGIMTRVMTFVFLPLLGLTHAMQSIVGNNFGAQAWDRSDQSLRIGIWIALVYCTLMQLAFVMLPEPIARLFVSDPGVIAEFARILPVNSAMLWLAGPLIVIATYFQAIGNATRAALLGLTKSYAFGLPLIFLLPLIWGEWGIWYAGPWPRC